MIQFLAETVFDLSVRNCFTFYALENVRNDLEKMVNAIAIGHFGTFFGPMIGSQLALLAAIPVTMMLAELFCWVVKEMIHSIYQIARRLLGYKSTIPPLSVIWQVASRVVSFCSGFFAKSYFSNKGMPYVASLLRFTANLQGNWLAPVMIPIVTPTVTFFVADIVGIFTSRITYNLLTRG